MIFQDHPLFNTWGSMRQRCLNPKHKDFHRYGGRGIKVCERWAHIANFVQDVGEKPSPKHTLDRIDNDGDYEPGNVRWATPAEQSRNRSTTLIIVVDGERKPLIDVVGKETPAYHHAKENLRHGRPWDAPNQPHVRLAKAQIAAVKFMFAVGLGSVSDIALVSGINRCTIKRMGDGAVSKRVTYFISATLIALLLTACDPSAYKAIDQLEFQSTGHAAVPDALLAQNQPVEAVSSSSASQEPIVVITPSSSVYVPPPEPPKIPCTEGQFRVYFCVNGFREYI